MKIIKRNGSEVDFDISKIILAVTKANRVVAQNLQLSSEQIRSLAANVETYCLHMGRAMNVEEIQDQVEDQIMRLGAYEVARRYIKIGRASCRERV